MLPPSTKEKREFSDEVRRIIKAHGAKYPVQVFHSVIAAIRAGMPIHEVLDTVKRNRPELFTPEAKQ